MTPLATNKVKSRSRSSLPAAEEVLASLAGDGHLLAQADLRDPESIRSMVDAAAGQLGGIDVLVNNAGVFIAHPIQSVDYATWQQAWAETLDDGRRVLAAVNQQMARMVTPVEDGDELAFFPPVTGG